MKVGSADFVGSTENAPSLSTSVYISSDEQYRGRYVFHNEIREGVTEVFAGLGKAYGLAILSGDNEGEKKRLVELLPKGTEFLFNQKPEDKLNFIRSLQEKGRKVIMVGDGLNDAGALMQSQVGIAVSENVNVFSPACDGILDASVFKQLNRFIEAAKSSITVIKVSLSLIHI